MEAQLLQLFYGIFTPDSGNQKHTAHGNSYGTSVLQITGVTSKQMASMPKVAAEWKMAPMNVGGIYYAVNLLNVQILDYKFVFSEFEF